MRVIVVSLVAILLAGCGSSQSNPSTAANGSPSAAVAAASPSPSARPSGSPRPTPTATPVPSPTATPAPTPKPTPQPWLAYRSKRNHYSIKYPPGWIVTPGTAKLPDVFDDYDHYLYVSRTTITGTISLSLTVTYEINYAKSHFKGKLVSSRNLTVTGWPAKLLLFNGTQDGRKVYVQELILARGSVAYILVWISDQGHAPADRKLFKRIYETFKRTS